jgi:hypothetical protein
MTEETTPTANASNATTLYQVLVRAQVAVITSCIVEAKSEEEAMLYAPGVAVDEQDWMQIGDPHHAVAVSAMVMEKYPE